MGKLLFFDIDGTLAMPGKKVSQRTRDAIRAARANGHKAFICTGRSPEIVNEDILSIGFDGGIFHAGGRAVIDGKTVYENHADAKMLDDVLPSIKKYAAFYNYETTGGDYYSKFDLNVLKEIQETTGVNTELLRLIEAMASQENRSVSDYAGEGIYKVFFFVRKTADYEKIIDAFGPGYLPTIFSNMIEDMPIEACEVTRADINKGAAILGLCGYLRADVSDTISFGDSMNDIMMIRTTGISVAMANAEQRVKDEADIICESCDDDGVAKELQRLGLI
jgi:Cof subfamily protein (haloacid dehalogenase superfamily)